MGSATSSVKYRKKPVVVEAIRTSEAMHFARCSWASLPAWLVAAYEKGDVVFADTYVAIKTLEGGMSADADSWIIRGVKGELYPCRNDIFEATYEPVTEEAS